jgi:Fe-S-cluster containining protein
MGRDLSWLNRPLQMWFQEAELRSFPPSPKLDCQSCSRAERAIPKQEKERWQKWKCCTFQPFAPNYLLGSMLESRSLPKNSHAEFTPLGLCPTPDYRTNFLTKRDEERGEEQICSFYDRQNRVCTQWRNRPSECSTYFCVENQFYRDRSQDLFDWEIAVAQMAMVEHGFTPREVELAIKGMDSSVNLKPDWGNYSGRSEEFYRACWQWAKNRKPQEVLSWLPIEAKARFDSWVRFS